MKQESILDRNGNSAPVSPRQLKQRRNLKIEDLSDPFHHKGRRVPHAGIRLKGQWLSQAGFQPGERVAVTIVEPGILQLRIAAESLEQQPGRLPSPQQIELSLHAGQAPENSSEGK